MSERKVSTTAALVGPERRVEAPCPSCGETIFIEGIMFRDDTDEVIQVCHWCETSHVIRRRTHFVGYTLTAE